MQETEWSRKDTEKVIFCLALFPPRAAPEQAFESKEFIWKVQDTPAGSGEVQQKKEDASKGYITKLPPTGGAWSSKLLEN